MVGFRGRNVRMRNQYSQNRQNFLMLKPLVSLAYPDVISDCGPGGGAR